ncbi:MAG: hypothetical protein AAGA48_39345 [Myxococcota bacterium]
MFDADDRMTSGSYDAPGGVATVERRGERWVGTHRTSDGDMAIDRPVDDRAVGGMSFVIATRMLLEEGVTRTFADHNDGRGFAPDGELMMRVGGAVTVALPEGEFVAHPVTLVRQNGGELVMWVDADARLVQADWGGGNHMIPHPTSTEHLFQPTVAIEQSVHDLDP